MYIGVNAIDANERYIQHHPFLRFQLDCIKETTTTAIL